MALEPQKNIWKPCLCATPCKVGEFCPTADALAAQSLHVQPGRWLLFVFPGDGYRVLRVNDDDSIGMDDGTIPGINAALDQIQAHGDERIQRHLEEWDG